MKKVLFGTTLVLIIVGAGYFFLKTPKSSESILQPSAEETKQPSNWQTYNYTEKGMSIQFPPTYKTSIGREGELFVNNTNVDGVIPNGEKLKQIQINTEKNPNTLDEILKNRDKINGQETKYTSIMIGSTPAKVTETGMITLVENGNVHDIFLTENEDTELNQILQTLKFN